MHAHRSTLDGLPIEILRRIASVGNCEAVLALSRVNKALHAACNDRLVYKTLINNRNGYGGPAWPHHLPLSMQSPVSSWARYALADSLAARDDTLNLKLISVVSLAPQLLVHHHPLINLVEASRLVHAVSHKQTGVEVTHALAFCVALRLMSKESAIGSPWPMASELPRSISAPGAQIRKDLMQYLKQPLQSPADAVAYFTACSPAMLMQKRVRALMAVGCFSVMLRETIERGDIGHLSILHRQPTTIAVPTSTHIPFHSLLDVPLPFSSSATTELASCHLAKMTTVDFLKEGEWAGFYSMSHLTFRDRAEYILFDPPMYGIHFDAIANEDDQTVIDLKAAGEDAIGAFYLEGKLAPRTGDILLTKTYSGGFPVWEWVCTMTPMGIVGSWGQAQHGGWIWLWKTAWTPDHDL